LVGLKKSFMALTSSDPTQLLSSRIVVNLYDATTFGTMTFGIMTFDIMTFGLMTIGYNDIQHNNI
jgi:hypothetical protein